MSDNEEFPSLNEKTQQIFDEFARVYKEDIIEKGGKEVAKMCAEYNANQEQGIGKEQNQPQIER